MLPADKALMERLGARLREARERSGLSQEDVGERAGFSGKYIGEIEKGVRDVPMSTLRAVVEAGLGLQLETIFGDRLPRRATERAPAARDIELTAETLSALPLRVRRLLLGLAEAFDDLGPPKHAAERAAPKSHKRR